MKINVPHNGVHPFVSLMVTTPKGTFEIVVDDSHRTFEVDLPEGVHAEEVAIVARYLTAQGTIASHCEPIVIHEPKAKPKPKPLPPRPSRPHAEAPPEGETPEPPQGDRTPEIQHERGPTGRTQADDH